jgi:hypothetical protein
MKNGFEVEEVVESGLIYGASGDLHRRIFRLSASGRRTTPRQSGPQNPA